MRHGVALHCSAVATSSSSTTTPHLTPSLSIPSHRIALLCFVRSDATFNDADIRYQISPYWAIGVEAKEG